jgi:type VI secretion system protein VasJ
MENAETTEVKEPEIPEFVKEYLEPVPGEIATGTDAANEEEYFKLNMEIPKTAPDYKKCIEYSDLILREKSKDIKVATWLCFALFRTEKLKGLKDGLNLIYYLLTKFGNDLYPVNHVHRSKALQFLNTARFFKLVEKEEITRSNARDMIEAGETLNKIIDESKKLFPDSIPILKSFKDVIDKHAESARSLTAPPKELKREEPGEIKQGSAASVAKTERPVSQAIAAPKEALTSEKDAVKQLRQTIQFFFEREADGTKKELVPESTFVFGISRQLQWGKLVRPADSDKVTQIDAPNQIIQNKMKEWFSSSNWDTLIPRIEISFLKPDSEFPYWLDIQRYVTKALEQKGGNYTQAAQEIKMHLAMLLKRIPDLIQLKFKDKQTLFADNETKKWIDDEVKSMLGGGSGGAMLLPPIMGEDYEPLNEEYQNACNELPGNFEENLEKMQKGIQTDERRKGKFLRRLNQANYCFAAKQYNLAKINLLELKKLIDENYLAEWESALCTSVWQSLYLTNSKILMDMDKGVSKVNIESEQEELFSKIAKYNGVLAIKLINNLKS